jgi:hypothetical protein
LTDDVFFDGNGNSNCLASNGGGGNTIKSLTVSSGYTSTLDLGSVGFITVLGNVELGANMTVTSTGGYLRVGVSGSTFTFKTNGCVIGSNLTIGHSSGTLASTTTLLDNVVVTGLVNLTQGSATGDVITNGFQIECRGNVIVGGGASGRVSSGTTLILINGTGAQQLSSGSGTSRNPITVIKRVEH